jgi:hypothetical protein
MAELDWSTRRAHPIRSPRREAASEEDVLRSFARERGLKRGSAEKDETGSLVLTNLHTDEQWWVIQLSGVE